MKPTEKTKKTLKRAIPALIMVGFFWTLALFGASITWLTVLALAGLLFFDVKGVVYDKKEPEPWKLLGNALSVLLVIHVMIWMYYYLGGYGFLGLIIIVLIYSGYVLVRRRKLFMEAIYDMETLLYGQPLGKGGKEYYERNKEEE